MVVRHKKVTRFFHGTKEKGLSKYSKKVAHNGRRRLLSSREIKQFFKAVQKTDFQRAKPQIRSSFMHRVRRRFRRLQKLTSPQNRCSTSFRKHLEITFTVSNIKTGCVIVFFLSQFWHGRQVGKNKKKTFKGQPPDIKRFI